MASIIEDLYVGDGSTVLYSFTFPYIEESDIKVSLDGVNTTEYSLANATTVEFVAAPANGVAIRIYRDTSVEEPKAVFYPGSAIRAQDLNDNFEQNLFVIQEADFNNDQSASDSAAALATAQVAETKADQANVQSAAAEASAATANANATQAAADAAQAQADATAAASDATAAQASADQANAAVQAAAIFAPVANVAAIPSSPADQDRVSVRDSTGIESFTPLTGLPVGPSYDSGTYVNLVYQNIAATWVFVAYGPNDPDTRYLLDVADSVDTSNISDDAVTTDKIVNAAVTTDKIVNAAVTTDKLVTNAVTTDKIVDAAVTTDKIADSSVNTDKLAATVVLLPTGAITAFGGSTAPTGYLECNGQSTAGYAALAAIVGATVPDLRGEFIRGFDSGRGVDSGRVFGSSQEATEVRTAADAHGGNDVGGTQGRASTTFRQADTQNTRSGTPSDAFLGDGTSAAGLLTYDNSISGTVDNTGVSASENVWISHRPRNIALMYIIKT